MIFGCIWPEHSATVFTSSKTTYYESEIFVMGEWLSTSELREFVITSIYSFEERQLSYSLHIYILPLLPFTTGQILRRTMGWALGNNRGKPTTGFLRYIEWQGWNLDLTPPVVKFSDQPMDELRHSCLSCEKGQGFESNRPCMVPLNQQYRFSRLLSV